MKRIYVNLKRFDVPNELGGVNRLTGIASWARFIADAVQDGLSDYTQQAEFTIFFPEAHLLSAVQAAKQSSLRVGCQGVHREDIALGGNFGAFTGSRPAAAAKAMGCKAAIIGHCEERQSYSSILELAGCGDFSVVNTILKQEILCAVARDIDVLYCIGETAEQRENWQSVLRAQLSEGLREVETEKITIGYEPIWAIGPGRTPPDRNAIQEVARFIKEETGGLPVVYGGGLKVENAAMLASIPEIDGGLIALTRFSGDIGFYPEEYLDIVRLYLGK